MSDLTLSAAVADSMESSGNVSVVYPIPVTAAAVPLAVVVVKVLPSCLAPWKGISRLGPAGAADTSGFHCAPSHCIGRGVTTAPMRWPLLNTLSLADQKA